MGMRQMFGLGGGKPKGKLEDAPIAELEALEAKQRGTFGGQLISTALGKAREKKRKADLLTMPNAPDAGPVVITSNLLAARRAGERTRRGAVGDASAQAVAGRTRLG